MLKVEYVDNSQEALLSVGEPSLVWNSVRRLCESQTERVKNRSATSLSLPWWAFLRCRSGLRTILASNGMKPWFSPRVTELLVAARERENAYQSSKEAAEVPAGMLQEQLRSAGFTRELTQEQLRNIRKLAGLPAGASFSVPGAGKTTEALAYFFYKRTPETRLLIVAPKNAFAPWEEQLTLCAPNSGLRIVRLRGGQEAIEQVLRKDPMIAIISYQQLLSVLEEVAEYVSRHSTMMVVDESHRIKGGQAGAWGRAVLRLSHLPETKLILSGTPLPNTVSDLLPQFGFLYPEVKADENTVQNFISPVYVRTKKSELGLKAPTRYVVPVPLAPAQRHLYDLLRSELARQITPALDLRDKNRLRYIGRSVMRLLQLCSNPALLATVPFPYSASLSDVLTEGDAPKMRYACRRARELVSRGKRSSSGRGLSRTSRFWRSGSRT